MNESLNHFYRATVNHADTWSQRLDATTNGAIVTTVGVVSFSFGSPDTPHFILLTLLVANSLFLMMETRRYQLYDVWQTRPNSLHRYNFAPVLIGERPLFFEGVAPQALPGMALIRWSVVFSTNPQVCRYFRSGSNKGYQANICADDGGASVKAASPSDPGSHLRASRLIESAKPPR